MRFRIVSVDGWLSVLDTQTGLMVEHAAEWIPEDAEFIAANLEERPHRAIVWNWVQAPVAVLAVVA